MAHLVIYGTELEELDDETSSFVFATVPITFDHIAIRPILLIMIKISP